MVGYFFCPKTLPAIFLEAVLRRDQKIAEVYHTLRSLSRCIIDICQEDISQIAITIRAITPIIIIIKLKKVCLKLRLKGF